MALGILLQQEHKLAKDRDKQRTKEITKKFHSLDDYKMNDNRNSNNQAMSLGSKSKTVLTREPPANTFDDKRPFNARFKSKSVTQYPVSDRTYDRNQKWRDPSLMITGDTSINYSNSYVTNARKSTSETAYTIPASTANATHISSSVASAHRNSHYQNTTSTATQTSSKVEKPFPKVELYPETDHPVRIADANGYAMYNSKSKSAKDLRDGITNLITGKEDRKTDKYFEVCLCMCACQYTPCFLFIHIKQMHTYIFWQGEKYSPVLFIHSTLKIHEYAFALHDLRMFMGLRWKHLSNKHKKIKNGIQ